VTGDGAREAMDAAVERVLGSQWDGAPLVAVRAAPGAGKSGMVERLAVQSVALMGERVAVAVNTRNQAADIARRLAGWQALDSRIWLFAPAATPAPCDTVPAVSDLRKVPDGPGVVVATTAKWSVSAVGDSAFDVLVADEAWQMSDAAFSAIAKIGSRVVLIGDPGQIDPMAVSDTSMWDGSPVAPHQPAPEALLARRSDVEVHTLPATRRLPADTVAKIQPAFYPDLPFGSIATPRFYDGPLAGGGTLTAAVCDPRRVVDTVACLVQNIVCGGGTVVADNTTTAVTADNIGIVVATKSLQGALSAAVEARVPGVFCDTANRWQGLERDVVIAVHPLVGAADASEFELDRGRICVMTSRHRARCWLVTTSDTADLVAQCGTGARRSLDGGDPFYTGWRSHLQLLDGLVEQRLG
jgi:hypothetical protein